MYTDERNKLFQESSRTEQRLMIAHEALLLLKLNKITPVQGEYVCVKEGNEREQFTDYFADSNAKCKVCAVGSIAISLYNITNHATVSDIIDNCFISSSCKISEYFNITELYTMEAAFEGYYHINGDYSYAEEMKVRHFYSKYPREEDRITAIWLNVVKNNGTFHPATEDYEGVELEDYEGDEE